MFKPSMNGGHVSQGRQWEHGGVRRTVINTPTIENFAQAARSYRNVIGDESCTIECITTIHEHARELRNQHVYNDPYFVVQMAGGMRGSCFGFPEDAELEIQRFTGLSAFNVLDEAPDYLTVCLLDGIYQEINRIEGILPTRSIPYIGSASENGRLQAKTLADLAHVTPGTKVALVGMVEDIVREIVDRGAEAMVADLYLAGQTVYGQHVMNDASSCIAQADSLIMTGNTLKTRTLDALLSQAKSLRVRTVIFAMSGANLAPRYCYLGADAVTTERFPYFWYPGLGSTINVFES